MAFQVLWLLGFAAQALVHGSLVGVALLLVVAFGFVTWSAVAAAWHVHRGASVILYTLLAWELFATVISDTDTPLRAV